MLYKKILILGESHTRQFAYVDNILPIFLGRGTLINLENITNIKDTIDRVYKQYNRNEYITFLYLGEPNCRIKLANHWTPHWDEIKHNKKIKSAVDKTYLIKCFENYETILNIAEFIITPTSGYDPVIPSLIFFNNLLIQKYSNKVIDIFSNTIEGDKVKDYYKSPNWKDDPIHLNSRICSDFINILFDKKIINDKSIYKKQLDFNFGTHYLRSETNNKFGTIIVE